MEDGCGFENRNDFNVLDFFVSWNWEFLLIWCGCSFFIFIYVLLFFNKGSVNRKEDVCSIFLFCMLGFYVYDLDY